MIIRSPWAKIPDEGRRLNKTVYETINNKPGDIRDKRLLFRIPGSCMDMDLRMVGEG
jgi:hypothetical protein